jgi:hypothetical protein
MWSHLAEKLVGKHNHHQDTGPEYQLPLWMVLIRCRHAPKRSLRLPCVQDHKNSYVNLRSATCLLHCVLVMSASPPKLGVSNSSRAVYCCLYRHQQT